MSIKKHIPNAISTLRLIMAPFIPAAFLSTSLISISYFFIGNLTDALDGFLARRWHVQSRYGKVVDPFADKLFNLLALGFAGIIINPILIGVFVCESTIAAVSTAHAIHNIKAKKINWKSINLFEKIEMLFDAIDSLKVSRVGRKKACFMVASVIAVLLTPFIPSLAVASFALVGLTTVLEIPTITKYVLEYAKDLDKISENGNVMLNNLNNLDQLVDQVDDKIVKGVKKIFGVSNKAIDKEDRNIKTNEEITYDDDILKPQECQLEIDIQPNLNDLSLERPAPYNDFSSAIPDEQMNDSTISYDEARIKKIHHK